MKTMKQIKQGYAALVTLVFTIAVTSPAHATNDQLYYRIGGGQLSDSALAHFNTFEIDLDVYASGQYSCGDFDISESIKELIKEIENIPDEFEEYLKVASLDLLYGLIALSIQKAAPGVYEYLTNAYARHKEFIQLKLATCRNIETLVRNNGIQEFKDLAKIIQYRRGVETGQPIQEAERAATPEQGIPWIEGRYHGGAGQPPILLVEHSVRTGYQHINGGLTASGDASSTLAQVFPTAASAQAWATAVYGEKIISLVDPSRSETGSGLQAQIAETEIVINETLAAVLNNPTGASAAQLDTLSTPSFRITPAALAAINSQNADARAVFKHRLASEIATYQAIEKAYLIRSFLVSALDHPHFYFTEVMPAHIAHYLDRIDDGIRVARDRARLRREFVGGLMLEALRRSEDIEQQSVNLPQGYRPQETLPGGGTVKQ